MKIKVMNAEISVQRIGNEDYISLTDMARSQMQEHIIFKWLSTKSTIEYLGEWESLYNPDFNYTEFGTIKNMAGSNNFVLSTKQWILSTNALGIVAKTGRYWGTFAHRDIAYHFGMWISPRFHLLLIHEYQRLNCRTGSIGLVRAARTVENQLPYPYGRNQAKLDSRDAFEAADGMVYASEADVLNVALFGFTAKEWRDAHADLQGNVRDYATVNQLICLSNMESLNSVLIKEGLPQPDRLQKLNQIAISQMTVLESIGENKLLK